VSRKPRAPICVEFERMTITEQDGGGAVVLLYVRHDGEPRTVIAHCAPHVYEDIWFSWLRQKYGQGRLPEHIKK
jgi:hypothetical protein